MRRLDETDCCLEQVTNAKRFPLLASQRRAGRLLPDLVCAHPTPHPVGSGTALALLFGSLIGSYFNIPLTEIEGEQVLSRHYASIGGAGSFHGTFLIGILAVLLASIGSARQSSAS